MIKDNQKKIGQLLIEARAGRNRTAVNRAVGIRWTRLCDIEEGKEFPTWDEINQLLSYYNPRNLEHIDTMITYHMTNA